MSDQEHEQAEDAALESLLRPGMRRVLIAGAQRKIAVELINLLLADRRVMAVRAILRERGVPSERAQAIAYGTLEASDAYDPREQRVELLWQGEGSAPTSCRDVATASANFLTCFPKRR